MTQDQPAQSDGAPPRPAAQTAAGEGRATVELSPAARETILRALEGEQPGASAAQSKPTLERILAEPQFTQGGFTSSSESFLDKLLDRLQRLLAGAGLGGGTAVAMLTVVIILGICYLLFRLCWELFQRRAARSLARTETALEDQSSEVLLNAAETAARQGDFRTALRWRFLALVKQLDLPASALQTNTQLLRLVRKANTAAAAPFGAAAAAFEDAWYGNMPCSRIEYDEVVRQAGEALRAWTVSPEAAA
jgi:hypothetical protein